jgi:peptidoglycan hydrolase CwlO-like protein
MNDKRKVSEGNNRTVAKGVPYLVSESGKHNLVSKDEYIQELESRIDELNKEIKEWEAEMLYAAGQMNSVEEENKNLKAELKRLQAFPFSVHTIGWKILEKRVKGV